MAPFGKKQKPKLAFDEAIVEQYCQRLEHQSRVTRGYSPLLTAILDLIVGWLRDPEGAGTELESPDELVALCNRFVGYLEDTRTLADVEANLRLAATLHWYVLEDDPRVKSLRPYYRTVGGEFTPEGPRFARALLGALDGLGELLFEHARDWKTQSNETSRGLTWMLPAAILHVDAVHLVELGASAGLNLYGESRGYRLEWPDGSSLRLGRAQSDQFRIEVEGRKFDDLDRAACRGPDVLDRMGGDVSPIDLQVARNAGRLSACVWGDQPHRLERLREGLAIHRAAVAGEHGPVARVVALELPEGLEGFLSQAVPRNPTAPVIAFNSYVTAYLNDVDQRAVLRTMSEFAHRFSVQHGLPWMWVRFEPARVGDEDEPQPGWCRWVVEMWEGSRHRSFELGWAHPHLRQVQFGPGLEEFMAAAEASE